MYIDHSTLKYLVNKHVFGGNIWRWLLLFQENNFKVIVKPRCLNVSPDHLSSVESGDEPTSLEEGLPGVLLFSILVTDDHFVDIIQFLSIGTTLKGYLTQQKKELMVYAANFSMIIGHLYKMGSVEILCRYIPNYERSIILVEEHVGVARGHYGGRETAQKILLTGLWWPTMHKDWKVYCRVCDAC